MKDFFFTVGLFSGVLIILVLIYIAVDVFQFQYRAVEGEHNVVLTAVEKTKINTSVFAKTEGESSQEDVYCIHNSNISNESFTQIQELIKSKKNVMLSFSQEYKLFPWECRDVVSVKAL